MEDIPQPASEAYSTGDHVQIYIDSNDPDSQYHGIACEVIAVLDDDLGTETGRKMDGYSYTLRDIKADEELPISFRHHDLVPVRDDQ